MKRKLLGGVIQEIIERQMVLAMTRRSNEDLTTFFYNNGRHKGLSDAIKVIQNFF